MIQWDSRTVRTYVCAIFFCDLPKGHVNETSKLSRSEKTKRSASARLIQERTANVIKDVALDDNMNTYQNRPNQPPRTNGLPSNCVSSPAKIIKNTCWLPNGNSPKQQLLQTNAWSLAPLAPSFVTLWDSAIHPLQVGYRGISDSFLSVALRDFGWPCERTSQFWGPLTRLTSLRIAAKLCFSVCCEAVYHHVEHHADAIGQLKPLVSRGKILNISQ
jgi:hypothetical protein